MKKIVLLLFTFVVATFANILQDVIDKTQPYSTIKLPAGVYNGPLIINKPINIIGNDSNVIIQGNQIGQVITINSSYVTLKNLQIRGSGNQIISLDSAIQINKASHCEINSCTITDSLYGIDMVMVNDSIITNNYITSKKNEITFRGDALKIWYSNNNIINNNTIEYSRDTTLTYSDNNTIQNNTFLNNRFAIHLSMSNNNILQSNIFKYNSTAIMVMMGKDTQVLNNKILSCKGAAGIGVVLKDVSNFLFEKNNVKFNAVGIYIDTKENELGMQRKIINNLFAYNKEAFNFHAVIKNNKIIHNNIYSNIDDVVKNAKTDASYLNIIEYNYWDRYTGFDKNNDNIGDNSHKIYQYADQLWHYNNNVKFFYASPVMTLLNFLVNLAPFVEPDLIIEDKKPLMKYN